VKNNKRDVDAQRRRDVAAMRPLILLIAAQVRKVRCQAR
jgi:hypothetical protein